MRNLKVALATACAVVVGWAFTASADIDPSKILAFWDFNNPSNPLKQSAGVGQALSDTAKLADGSAAIDYTGGCAHFRDAIASGTLSVSGGYAFSKALAAVTDEVTVEFFVRQRRMPKTGVSLVTQTATRDTVGKFGLVSGGTTKYEPGTIRAGWSLDLSLLDSSHQVLEPPNYSLLKSPTAVLADGGWHHVAYYMNFTASGTRSQLYVDGVSVAEGPAATSTVRSLASQTWSFGVSSSVYMMCPNGFSYPSLVGDLDDIRFTAAKVESADFLKAPTVAATDHPAGAVTWKSGVLSGLWTDDANWEGGKAPGIDDDVYIPSWAVARIDGVASAKSVVVDGAVVFSTDTGKLTVAGDVTVGYGLVRAGAAFGNEEPQSKVWIACDNLTVSAHGSIDVTGQGYAGVTYATTPASGGQLGCGPGATLSSGSSHGGSAFSRQNAIAAYGDAALAETHGSGGSMPSLNGRSRVNARAPDGGGVVRIEATGVIRVDGDIRADAQEMPPCSDRTLFFATSASGGSVYLSCAKLTGSGLVSANGGAATFSGAGMSGSGGRIAVHYGAAQTAADLASLTLQAAAGRMSAALSTQIDDASGRRSQSGTIWLPDTKVVDAVNFGRCFAGRLVVPEVAELTLDGDVTLTKRVGFAADGFALTVAGDLAISGSDARLEMGSGEIITGGSNLSCRFFDNKQPSALSVGGALSLQDGGALDVYSAATADVLAPGATVTAESIAIGSGSCLSPYSHPTSGSSVLLTCSKDMTIDEGGTLGGKGQGYGGAYGRGNAGYGPGKGFGNSTLVQACAAGHGGTGAAQENAASSQLKAYGNSYDNAVRPLQAGSGGGCEYDNALCGGGYVHARVGGTLTVNGSVLANGVSCANAYGNNGRLAPGAGGGILLECKAFASGENAVITARGGGIADGSYATAAGGGRIAIWTGALFEDTGKYPRANGSWPKSVKVLDERPAEVLGTIDANKGTVAVATPPALAREATDGTVRYVVYEKQGLRLLIR